MLRGHNDQVMGGLFGLSSGAGSSGFDYSALQDYYAAKSKAKNPGTIARKKPDPPSAQYAPWVQKSTLTTNAAKLRDALGTTSFVDVRDSDINKTGIDADHKKLFAMYKGLTRLQALATPPPCWRCRWFQIQLWSGSDLELWRLRSSADR